MTFAYEVTGIRRLVYSLCFLAGGTMTASTLAAQGPTGRTAASDGNQIEVRECMVITINDVPVPAQVEGMLTEIRVEEGQSAEAGQPLAMLDDREAQLNLKLKKAEEEEARLNATNDINRQYAIRSKELSEGKAEAWEELYEDRLMAKWEARQARLEAYRDQLQISLAEINQDIAKAQFGAKQVEREVAELAVYKRAIIAPFTGVVEQRIAQQGEWVQPGSPIVRMIQMDRLRVTGFVDQDLAVRLRAGMPATLTFSGVGKDGQQSFPAKLGFVGNEVDLSNRCRVWVEFQNIRDGNEWLIKPGMQPEMSIQIP